jgi:hypothetical protein
MFAEADRIGKVTEQMRGRVPLEFERFGAIDASAVQHLLCDRINHGCGRRRPFVVQKNSNCLRRAKPRSAA